MLQVCTIICLGVNRHLVSGHEISRLQHGLQLIMARYTRIINCRPCRNLYVTYTPTSWLPVRHLWRLSWYLMRFGDIWPLTFCSIAPYTKFKAKSKVMTHFVWLLCGLATLTSNQLTRQLYVTWATFLLIWGFLGFFLLEQGADTDGQTGKRPGIIRRKFPTEKDSSLSRGSM